MALPLVHRAQGMTLRFRLGERGVRPSTADTADVFLLEEWFSADDVFARDALLDAAALVGFDADDGHATPTDELFAFVAAHVAEGSLRVERVPDGWPVFRGGGEREPG